MTDQFSWSPLSPSYPSSPVLAKTYQPRAEDHFLVKITITVLIKQNYTFFEGKLPLSIFFKIGQFNIE